MRSEACWGALTFSRKAPPQGSFPDCGKPFGAPGVLGFLWPRRFLLPPHRRVPRAPAPCPRGRAAPILGLPTQANQKEPSRRWRFYHSLQNPAVIEAFNLKYDCYFPGAELDRKSQLFIKDKEVNYQPGQWRDGGDLACFLSVPRGIYGGAAARAQTPLGSRGWGGGGARAEGLSPSPSRHLDWESSQVCSKPGSFQSWTALPSSSLLSSFSSCFDYCFPFASELSPLGSPLPTFSLPSPRFASPSPSFLLHRTRRVSFIYLFITPAINTLLGLPSFSMWVGGEKGRKCWLEGGEIVSLGERFCPGINDWGKAWKRIPICL